MNWTSTSFRSLLPRSVDGGRCLRRCAGSALAGFSLLLLAGCRVVILSGPSEVDVGDTVVYVLELGSNQGGQSGATLSLDVLVPTGWSFVSGAYQGLLGGEETSGPLRLGGAETCSSLQDPPTGFQQLTLGPGGTFGTLSEDEGTVTLEFQVLDQPSGAYDIRFVFGGEGDFGPGCSAVTRKRINREDRALLELEQVIRDPAGDPIGTGRIERLVASSDSRDLYSFRRQDVVDDVVIPGAVSLYRRGGAGALGGTGDLELVEGTFDNAELPLGDVMDAILSPDERHLYVVDVDSDELGLFERVPATGSLSFVESLPIAPRNVYRQQLAISPDGLFLYLGDLFQAEIAIFSRDPGTGALTPAAPFDQLVTPPSALVLDPTGSFLYAAFAEEDKLLVFAREPRGGGLVRVQEVVNGQGGVEGLASPSTLAQSPDGISLYAGGILSKDGASLVAFERDLSTGALTFLDASPTFPPIFSNEQAFSVSPDGEQLFATLRAALVVYRRAPDGSLTFEDSYEDGYFLRDLLLSADQRHLVTSSRIDRALLSYRVSGSRVFTDGFESGDTSAWTSTSP